MLFPPIRPTICLLLLMSRTSPKLHQMIASLYFLSVISYTRTSVLSPSLGDYYSRLLLVPLGSRAVLLKCIPTTYSTTPIFPTCCKSNQPKSRRKEKKESKKRNNKKCPSTKSATQPPSRLPNAIVSPHPSQLYIRRNFLHRNSSSM